VTAGAGGSVRALGRIEAVIQVYLFSAFLPIDYN
jgi:hypothetical protein